MDVLLGLDIQGLPGSEYVFLNVETGVYLYTIRNWSGFTAERMKSA